MFAHAFVRNAYLAGTFIALASGVVGWFVVARAQLFAGDALSHVAFVGAIAAAVVGVDERVGLFAVTLAVAAGLAALGGRERQDDAAIGTVFAWILGIGVLLIAVLATSESGGAGVTTTNALFGSIYSLSTGASWLAAAIALAVTIAVAAVTRPLLLATIDAEQAAARGVPVKLLGLGILLALATVTAEGTQAVGVLLILVLLIALLATSEGGGAGVTTTNALFGSIYSLSAGASWLAAAIAMTVTIAVTAMTRPLLLTTIDAEQAAARGVPVRLLGLGILLALAGVTAEGTQAVGALLILGLLSAPAGAAHRLTANPYAGVAISSLIAVAATWGGLALSYEISSLPPSSAIIGLAAAAFAIASLLARSRR